MLNILRSTLMLFIHSFISKGFILVRVTVGLVLILGPSDILVFM